MHAKRTPHNKGSREECLEVAKRHEEAANSVRKEAMKGVEDDKER